MRRIRAPFDEEREEAIGVVLEVDRLPMQHAAIGSFTRTRSRPFGDDSGPGQVGCKHFQIAGTGGPADQARSGKRLQSFGEWIFGRLLRVGRDDFQVAALSEREKRIFSTAARMNSAKFGSHASVLFDEGDTRLEVAAAEKDVIEHGRHLIDERHIGFLLALREEDRRRKRGRNTKLNEGSAAHGVD